ncbi:DUF2971 domain-containing protein [Dokdonella immobilis]|uniref:DUF2971 domain-containing protein n=1 Tax=Dokdonella immobilis TaxID=578942 RepID=UPI001587AD12|nr:DUF2971 domain-containing protein [Dokdonella immobilis]
MLPKVDDSAGWQRLEDIVVRNQLWMASADSLNDPFDFSIHYKMSEKGAALRRSVEHYFRRENNIGSARARTLVRSDLIANPKLLERLLRNAHERFLRQLGVCSFSADPRVSRLWSHYSNDHSGICIQFDPSRDPRCFVLHRMTYSKEPKRVIESLDQLDHDTNLRLLMEKEEQWKDEREWRAVEIGNANIQRGFRPDALTGIILGLRCRDAAILDILAKILGMRQSKKFPMPEIYQVVKPDVGTRLRLLRVP